MALMLRHAQHTMADMSPGFLHPIIHLGFGVEFHQPAIIAEALAQAAIHSDWMKPFLIGAEKAAKENNVTQSKTLVELLDAIKADEKVAKAPRWDDGNKLRDGIVKRVPEEMIKYASQYVVHPEELEEKTAEMTNAASKSPLSPFPSSPPFPELTKPHSLLHRRSPTPTPPNQIRLLLHPLHQQLHLLLRLPLRTLALHRLQMPPPGMERPE